MKYRGTNVLNTDDIALIDFVKQSLVDPSINKDFLPFDVVTDFYVEQSDIAAYIGITKEYLNMYGDNYVSSAFIHSDRILDCILEWERDKNPRAHKLKMLPDVCLIEILRYYFDLCMLDTSFNPNPQDMTREQCRLAIYNNTTGCYSVERIDITGLMYAFEPRYTDKQVKDLFSKLSAVVTIPIEHVSNEINLIALNNYIYNYDTDECMDYDVSFKCIYKLPVNYNPDAVNPVPVVNSLGQTLEFDVEEWFRSLSKDPAIVELLWQMVGATIRVGTPWDKAFLLFSPIGENGKGTLCTLLRNIMGVKNCASMSIKDFGDNVMMSTLANKSAVICDENDVGTFIDQAANFKSVITHDSYLVNPKYQAPYTATFRGTIIQCINERPRMKDRSNSIYRRFCIIPMTSNFTGVADRDIKRIYMQDDKVLEYIVKRVLTDMPKYYELMSPDSVMDELQEYKTVNDPIREFWELDLDCGNILAGDQYPFTTLYEMYKVWYKMNYGVNYSAISRNQFIQGLRLVIDPSQGWEITIDNKTKFKTTGLPQFVEPLIQVWNIETLKNPNYKGNDVQKLCTIMMPQSFRGIRRKLAIDTTVVDVDAVDVD